MTQRIAASLALVAFAVCLLVGVFEAGNGFVTTVWRALVAMAATYVVGLVVGAMCSRMIDDNVKSEEAKARGNIGPGPR